MADRPIRFSAPMVRALLDGRKTQTRLAMSLRGYRGFHQFGPSDTPGYDWTFRRADWVWEDFTHEKLSALLPYATGDRLWVREAHALWADEESARAAQWLEGSDDPCVYRADYKAGATCENMGGDRWRPSIHMPRSSSRLTLTVTDVRVQRLQDISAADTVAEGVQCKTCAAMPASACHGKGCFASRLAFRDLWNSINGPYAWDANPWVVALTFAVHRCNIDKMGDPA